MDGVDDEEGELKSFETRPMRRNDTYRTKPQKDTQTNNRLSIY